MSGEHPAAAPGHRVGEVARLFLLLGTISFGGPAAHIALMRREVVERRGWTTDADFLDWVGATNLIPGPNSTELAIHLGHQRGAGRRGLVAAGVCFILPAVAIVSVLAWAYRRYGTTPTFLDLRYGLLPVIVAIIIQALVGLARAAINRVSFAVLAAAGLVAFLAGVHELIVLAVAGTAASLWARRRHVGRGFASVLLALPAAARQSIDDVSLSRLFLVFLEIGSVLYGSGYVLIAFLERNLVDQLGWLTEQQLLDAVTVGQITPGPVFTTATFIGWQVEGPAGAAVATLGIFLPSFLFVAALGRIVPWMRRHPAARAFLDGVNAASLGLMAAVVLKLAGAAFPDAFTILIGGVALVVLLRYRPNSVWLVAAGAVIGLGHAALA